MFSMYWAAEAAKTPPPWLGFVSGGLAAQFVFVVFLFAATYGLIRRLQGGGRVAAIRKIAGLDAINEAVGRATEMGRPVHFTPGIGATSDPQSYAAFAVLGEVGKLTARYDTRIIVTTANAIMTAITDEIVRGAYLESGRPDAFNPDDIRYLSSAQFAYSAQVLGIFEREKVAANIMVGVFAAEALLLAEAGAQIGAIQIAASTNTFQLPFFVAACDYTLIGDEMYAASAYLSKDPALTGTVVAEDWAKMLILGVVVLGAILNTVGSKWLQNILNR
ncbi:MAG: hypothetical protein M1299_09795 [Firmicutes bacterium]|nr:hypothetical protein [Bacillota bacterium]MCL5040097.1 hypothetical protein [Bacillota bacterium]